MSISGIRSLRPRDAIASRESIAAYKTLYREGMATTLKEGLEFERSSVFEISDTDERLAAFMKKD